MLQALISDVATVIYQCCDGPSGEKILIGRPGASSADSKFFLPKNKKFFANFASLQNNKLSIY
jgi:hypothetical protein